MTWQLAIIVHSILGGLRIVQNRRLGQSRYDVTHYALMGSFLAVMLLGVLYNLVSPGPLYHQAAWGARYYLLGGGVLFAFNSFLTIRMFRLIPASIGALLSVLSSISVVILSLLFAGERMTTIQWIGSVLLLGAVYLVQHYSQKHESKRVQNNIIVGLIIALTAAIVFGMAIVNEKYLLDRLSLHTYLMYGWGVQFVAALSIGLWLGKGLSRPNLSRRISFDLLIYALLFSISGIFFIFSLLSSDSSALTSVSSSIKIVVATILSYFLLHEQGHLYVKIVALLMSSVGLYCLFV